MITGACKMCGEIIHGALPGGANVRPPGSPPPSPDEYARECFAAMFGKHMADHHAAEYAGLQATFQKVAAIGMGVIGFLAMSYAQSSDPVFTAWRSEDQTKLAGELAVILGMVNGTDEAKVKAQ
jgi:hypothetical protein